MKFYEQLKDKDTELSKVCIVSFGLLFFLCTACVLDVNKELTDGIFRVRLGGEGVLEIPIPSLRGEIVRHEVLREGVLGRIKPRTEMLCERWGAWCL